jgi:hypothetical protein
MIALADSFAVHSARQIEIPHERIARIVTVSAAYLNCVVVARIEIHGGAPFCVR